MKQEFQYYREKWVINAMPLVQKTINELTNYAMKSSYHMDIFHEKLIDMSYKLNVLSFDEIKGNFRGMCRVSILTTGDKTCMGFAICKILFISLCTIVSLFQNNFVWLYYYLLLNS